MDFELANQLADRISRGENGGLHKKLVSLCTPYCFYVKRKFGFIGVSDKDIRNDLVPSAVDEAISFTAKKGKPFTICLQNIFRDSCRELLRILRERYTGDLLKRMDLLEPRTSLGVHKQSSPTFEAQQNEEMDAVCKELRNHETFSRDVITRKMKGSTYEEMAQSFGKPYNECKRVFWHDLDSMRKNLQYLYKEEDYYTM